MFDRCHPFSVCKDCHRKLYTKSSNSYYSPIEIHTPESCELIGFDYSNCDICDKKTIDDKKIIERNLVPCDSLSIQWTAAIDRDSSLHWDFGYNKNIQYKLWTILKECNIIRDLICLIEEYLCLDTMKIINEIENTGRKIDFKIFKNDLKQCVVKIYAINKYDHIQTISSWRYSNVEDYEIELYLNDFFEYTR
jgi:hypothetical protein